MKKAKYTTFSILVFLGLILTGELCAFEKIEYLNTQPPYSFVSYDFYESWSKAATDIITLAKQNNVIVFSINNNYNSMLEKNFIVYTTEELPEDVSSTLGVGFCFKSLVFGDTSISVDTFGNVPVAPSSPWLYIYGCDDNIKAFDAKLSLIYTNLVPLNNKQPNEMYLNIKLAFWAGFIICVVSLTFADASLQKKIFFIKTTFGASQAVMIMQNIFVDAFIYITLFIIGYFLTMTFTSIWHEFSLLCLIAVAIIIANSLVFLVLLKIDHRQVIGRSQAEKRVLRICYIAKAIISLPAILAIASAMALTMPTVKYIKANNFFADNKDYYFSYFEYTYNMTVGDNVDLLEVVIKNNTVNKEIYSEYFEKCEPIALYGFPMFDERIDTIYANRYAYDYLSSAVGDFPANDADIILMLPDGLIEYKEEFSHSFVQQIAANRSPAYSYDVLYYHSDIDVLCMDYNYAVDVRFTFVNNPIIIYTAEKPTSTTWYPNIFLGTNMYKITNDTLFKIMQNYELESDMVVITNVYEHYNHYWLLVKVGLFTAILIGSLAIILTIMMAYRIIDLEYKVNAIELCIKKIMGHSMLKRNVDIFITLLGFDLLFAAVSAAIYIRFEIGSPFCFLIATGIIFLIDMLVLCKSILRIEKSRMSEILKGGAL